MLTDKTTRDMERIELIRSQLVEVKAQTNINDHIGALITLATALNHKPAIKVLIACQTIRSLEGQVHDDLRNIVDRWRNNVLRYIEIYYPSVLTEVKRCV